MLLRLIYISVIILAGCNKSYSLPIDFTIIHSSSVWGETEPCGWPKNPLGGLARKASVIDKERLNNNRLIVVDSGDLFFHKSDMTFEKDNIEAAKIKSEIIVNCNNKMNYNAFTPGSRDFALGLKYLKKLESQSNFSYISSNLYDGGNRKRLFDPYKIENYDGFKVAYIGAASSFQKDSVLIREPISEIKEVYNEISSEADFVIVLFNGTKPDMDRLSKSGIGFDLILRSGGSSRASENGGNAVTPLYEAGNKGKYLNKINIALSNIGADLIDIDLMQKKIKQSKKHLKNKKLGDPNGNLDEMYKDKPKILDTINNHRDIVRASNTKINNAKNTINTKKIALDTKVDSKADILFIVDEGMAKIPKGPEMNDHRGRAPGHPHHGHNH